MSLLVDVAAATLSLNLSFSQIPWLEQKYPRVAVRGIACSTPEDVEKIFAVSASLPKTVTIGELVEKGWEQDIRCDHYDTTMLQMGPLPEPTGTIKTPDNKKTYRIYQMLMGTKEYSIYLYIVYQLP